MRREAKGRQSRIVGTRISHGRNRNGWMWCREVKTESAKGWWMDEWEKIRSRAMGWPKKEGVRKARLEG